jgi:hypothetical protein
MSTVNNEQPRLTPEGKFALMVIACVFPLFVVFLVLGKPILGVSICVCAAVVLTALRTTWDLREHYWYWAAVVVSIMIQPLFIIYVPWSNHAYRGTALLPFGMLDYLLVWGCIKITQKIMKNS